MEGYFGGIMDGEDQASPEPTVKWVNQKHVHDFGLWDGYIHVSDVGLNGELRKLADGLDSRTFRFEIVEEGWARRKMTRIYLKHKHDASLFYLKHAGDT